MRGMVAWLLLAGAFGVVWTPAFLAQQQESGTGEESEMAVDPVCHLSVRKNPELSVRYRGETYYFCMKADMETFRKDPEKYLADSDHTHPDPSP